MQYTISYLMLSISCSSHSVVHHLQCIYSIYLLHLIFFQKFKIDVCLSQGLQFNLCNPQALTSEKVTEKICLFPK